MANTRVTTANENPLCARLKVKFDGRGAGKAAVQTGTFNKIKNETVAQKKVRTVVDPFERTAEFVSGASVKKSANAETVRFEKATKRNNPEAAARRVEAYEVDTPFASGAYREAYARAAAIRARAFDGSEAKASYVREMKRKELAKGPAVFSLAWFKGLLLGNEDEVEVKKAPISIKLVIGIVIFCAVIMMMLFSFAQISEFKKEISALEAQKEELTVEISQLALDIDLKNDIRTIEQIATEEIGMVKSNRVESKYINVAQGERIVLPAAEETGIAEYGIFSGMMSTVQSNWDRLMEYID